MAVQLNCYCCWLKMKVQEMVLWRNAIEEIIVGAFLMDGPLK